MIKEGSTVTFHFSLHADDEFIESSKGNDPLKYVHGQGQLLPELEKQLEGMTAEDEKKVSLAPEQGYGPHLAEAVRELPLESFADPSALNQGDVVSGQSEQGEFKAIVAEVGEEGITLDFNHPLAGKSLVFDIQVVEVS